MAKRTEKCGRCSASTVVEVSQLDKSDEERAASDPFAKARIEVAESELGRVSPAVWLARASGRLNAAARRLTYDR